MESPFSVSVPADAYNVADNERNIQLSSVSVSVHGAELFRNAEVKFAPGRRYGLIGPNGRGKSTLLRLLATREIPCPKNIEILLVEQEKEVEALDTPAIEVIIAADTKRLGLLEEADRLRNSDDDDDQDRLQEVEEELIAIGAHSAEARARKILFGLGFPADWQDRPTKSFSGGWRKRIALACAVFMEPDLLMLDEPTNHLDLNAVLWLETYLPAMYNEEKKRPKGLIVVSHDVDFLDNVCSDIVHIDNFKLLYYRGNYERFVKGRAEIHTEHEKLFDKQQNQMRGMSKKQIDEKFKALARGEGTTLDEYKLEKRREYRVKFPFEEPPELRDNYIMKLEDVEFHYPTGPTLFRNLNLAIWTDSRVTLVGPNGIGKTTLLNLLCGLLEPTGGKATKNHLLRVGRYSQHFVDTVPLDKTPIEYLRSFPIANLDEFKARQILGGFGLEGHRHKEKIGNLSGGQKARVAFAAISIQKPHVLVLDEPTNHLDVESIEALASSINSFKGGVVLVSHNTRLIQETVKELWVVGNKTVDSKSFSNFDEYKEHMLHQMGLDDIRKKEEKEERDKKRTERLRRKAEAALAARQTAEKKNAKKKKKAASDDDEDEEEDEESEEVSKKDTKQSSGSGTAAAKPAAAGAGGAKLASFFAKKDVVKKK